jgi:hypothetical protein
MPGITDIIKAIADPIVDSQIQKDFQKAGDYRKKIVEKYNDRIKQGMWNLQNDVEKRNIERARADKRKYIDEVMRPEWFQEKALEQKLKKIGIPEAQIPLYLNHKKEFMQSGDLTQDEIKDFKDRWAGRNKFFGEMKNRGMPNSYANILANEFYDKDAGISDYLPAAQMPTLTPEQQKDPSIADGFNQLKGEYEKVRQSLLDARKQLSAPQMPQQPMPMPQPQPTQFKPRYNKDFRTPQTPPAPPPMPQMPPQPMPQPQQPMMQQNFRSGGRIKRDVGGPATGNASGSLLMDLGNMSFDAFKKGDQVNENLKNELNKTYQIENMGKKLLGLLNDQRAQQTQNFQKEDAQRRWSDMDKGVRLDFWKQKALRNKLKSFGMDEAKINDAVNNHFQEFMQKGLLTDNDIQESRDKYKNRDKHFWDLVQNKGLSYKDAEDYTRQYFDPENGTESAGYHSKATTEPATQQQQQAYKKLLEQTEFDKKHGFNNAAQQQVQPTMQQQQAQFQQQFQPQPQQSMPQMRQQPMPMQQNAFPRPFFQGGRVRRADGGPMSVEDIEYLAENKVPDISEERETRSPMIVVHMSEDELLELDKMQGGKSIDPATGFREYSALEDLLEIPEIRELLDELAAEMMVGGRVDENVSGLEGVLSNKLPPYAPSPSDFDPEVLETEAEGTNGDNELALLPVQVADYFDSLMGGKDINPETGLRQYGFFKEFIRVGATLVGGMLGGPVGAGVGAAAGNYLTGADASKSLRRGLGVGALTYGVGSLANMAAPGFMASHPTLAGMLGQGAGGAFGGLGASMGWGAAPPATTTGDTFKDIRLSDGAKKTAESSGMFGSLGNLLKNPAVPLIGGGALMALGGRQSAREQKEIEARQREQLDNLRKYYGIQSKPLTIKPTSYRPYDTSLPSSWDLESGRDTTPFGRPLEFNYADGGSVDHAAGLEPGEEYVTGFKYLDGTTTGQSDKIKINLPEGAYVTDASFTSMIGDGNSKAGAEKVAKLSETLVKKAKKMKNLEVPQGRVPALLSDGEAVIPPEAISALGGGSNKKGAAIMKKAIENARKHKSSKGKGLPPKAKPLHKYVPKETPVYKAIKKVG